MDKKVFWTKFTWGGGGEDDRQFISSGGGGTGEGGIYVMVDPMALKGSVNLVSSNTEYV